MMNALTLQTCQIWNIYDQLCLKRQKYSLLKTDYSLSSDFVFVALNIVKVASPQGQIVTEQLHDGCRVAILIFFKAIQISNSIVEGLLGQLASNFRWRKNLVVENWVVKSEAKSDRVRRLQFFGSVWCLFISILSILNHFFTSILKKIKGKWLDKFIW